MEQPKQLFKFPAGDITKAPSGKTPQQDKYESYARLIALGIFFIIAAPMIFNIFVKGPYTSWIIGVYWAIIICVGFFLLGIFIKKKFFQNKPKENQQETKIEKKTLL